MTLHRDVIITIVEDLIARRGRHEITETMFVSEISPLLTHYMKALEDCYLVRLDEYAGIVQELRAVLEEVQGSLISASEAHRSDLRDFDRFLRKKGLKKKFERWLWHQTTEGEGG
ncbi:hypothetical protein [Paenibacillus gansuensis]|uniref:Uncharacterized protein n=1 Tax=Paenibacillus gansuensis TaxID=306542 RepID=A0ABW5PGB7_9BACL